MDLKASARSKRAHSVQHKKAAQKPRPQNTSSSHTNPQGQNKDKARRSQIPPSQSLASNWDRYEEEFESSIKDVEGNEPLTTSQNDAVEPKSKGADFAFLISEAQNEQQAGLNTTVDSYAFTEFDRRISSTILVRGESLLSWCTDDNFIVDDRATSTHEASFLSLDLHALAMQLEKMDVSKRLFIGEDLLPIVQGLDDVEINAARNSKDLHPLAIEDVRISSTIGDVSDSNRLMPSNSVGFDDTVNVTPMPDEENSSRNFPAYIPMPDSLKDQNPQGEISTIGNEEAGEKLPAAFEGMSAEAELDMLLSSFGETKLLESFDMGEKFTSNLPEVLESRSLNLKESSVAVGTPPLWSSSTRGHSIDDVLFSQSSSANSGSAAAAPQPERPDGTSSSFSVSNPLDDFDSWLDTI